MNRTLLLYTVILVEGYVVLSTELLAIRQTIPYVGNGTDTVSVVIAAVLMPLAFGYFAGGHFNRRNEAGRAVTVRARLIRNIGIAQLFLLAGLSHVTLNIFFETLIESGIRHRLALIGIYSAVFLVMPVYLLGQTIPLVSHFFRKERLAEAAGRVLFFSTTGSFLGAVLSTLVLMVSVGVHNTASLNILLLAVLVILLSRNKFSQPCTYAAGFALAAIFMNSGAMMQSLHVVSNNQYNTAMVYESPEGERNLILNRTASSKYDDEGRKHEYIEFMEQQVIGPLKDTAQPKSILVIGAGAFTFGMGDEKNLYDFVDIDPALKEIAETYILKQKLGPNKSFHPVEARAFLAGTDKQYDAVVLDAYQGDIMMPEHLLTQEFYLQVRDHLNNDGVVAINMVASPSFTNAFSRHIDATLRSVFPYISRHIVGQDYKLWEESPDVLANVIYLYRRRPGEKPPHLYTDNKNTVFLDKSRSH